MSTPWVPPPRSYHLRVFAVSLAIVLLSLAGFLFCVRMEAIAPATGTITARDLHELRSPTKGLVEPGWYEGEVPQDDGPPLRVRLDGQGNGVTDPERGGSQLVTHYELTLAEQRRRVTPAVLRFHPLRAGDELWPGQVVATLRPAEGQGRLEPLEPRMYRGDGATELVSAIDFFRSPADRPRSPSAPAALRVPESGRLWMAVQAPLAPQQAVGPGDLIATVVPIDPETRRPLDLVALLEVDEKYWGEVAPGQTVRLASTMYNSRLHGHAEARIERLEPWGEEGDNGRRRFRAVAPVTQAPYPLWLGSSFQAEIVVGRKLVYRLVLEH